MLEVVEEGLAVVVSAVDVDLEVVQLLEDDVVRLEVEHPEVARCPPQGIPYCRDFLWFLCASRGWEGGVCHPLGAFLQAGIVQKMAFWSSPWLGSAAALTTGNKKPGLGSRP